MRQERPGRPGGPGRKFNHAIPQNKVARLVEPQFCFEE